MFGYLRKKKTDGGQPTKAVQNTAAAPQKSCTSALDTQALKPSSVPGSLPTVVGASIVVMFAALNFSKHIVRPYVHNLHLKPERFSQSGVDDWVLSQNQGKPGYFIDIGAFDKSGISNTRKLEENEWQGVCVDPMPYGFEHRSCGYVPRPLGPVDGEVVDIAGCESVGGPSGYSRNVGPTCAKSQVETMGVGFLLNMIEAPTVVDFFSMHIPTEMSVRILNSFPFDNYCVRAWSLQVDNDHAQQAKLHQFFRKRKCKTVSGVADFWAQCPCGDADGSATDKVRPQA